MMQEVEETQEEARREEGGIPPESTEVTRSEVSFETEKEAFSCPVCRREFETIQALRGHGKAHRGQKAKQQTSSPETTDELIDLRRQLEVEKNQRMLTEENLKKLKAEKERDLLGKNSQPDVVDVELARLLKVRTMKELSANDPVSVAPATFHNDNGGPANLRLNELERRNQELEMELREQKLSKRILDGANQAFEKYRSHIDGELEKVKKNSNSSNPTTQVLSESFSVVKDELRNLHAKSDLVLNWLLGGKVPASMAPASHPEIEAMRREGLVVESTTEHSELEKLREMGYLVDK